MAYNDIVWCPIDLPKFPDLNVDIDPISTWSVWQFFRITEKRNSPYEVSQITKEAQEKMPEIVNWIKLFPYKNIRNIKINYQTAEVLPHVDFGRPSADIELYENNLENEPCGYRVLIKGNRTNSLYIEQDNKKIYTTLPEDTDVYVLGHTNTIHGVDNESGRNTMFMHFEIDKEQHEKLLINSYEKYKKYAILKSDFK